MPSCTSHWINNQVTRSLVLVRREAVYHSHWIRIRRRWIAGADGDHVLHRFTDSLINSNSPSSGRAGMHRRKCDGATSAAPTRMHFKCDVHVCPKWIREGRICGMLIVSHFFYLKACFSSLLALSARSAALSFRRAQPGSWRVWMAAARTARNTLPVLPDLPPTLYL